jgi:hypothetical protein
MPEHDPFESFKTTMDASDLHPLPASEVRRRGDRLRRRNTALAAVGGTAAALVAVGVPVALVQGGGDDDAAPPPIANDPTSQIVWRSDIPRDFPLTSGMPRTNGHDGSPVVAIDGYQPQMVGPCGGPAWDVSDALDSLSAVYTGESQGGEDRVLSVFPDADAAEARMDALAREAGVCESRRLQAIEQVREDVEGVDTYRYINAYDTGEGVLHTASRVGNAILYETVYFNGARDVDAVVTTLQGAARDRREVVSAMCVFSADPC